MQRSRTSLLALLLLVPSLALVLLGVLTLRQQSDHEPETQRVIFQQIAGQIEAQFQQVEAALVDFVRSSSRPDFDAVQQRVARLETEYMLIGRAFIFGIAGLETSPLPAASYMAVSAGEKKEFRQAALAEAIPIYMAELKLAVAPEAKLRLLNQIARCYWRQGEWERAAEYDRQILALGSVRGLDFEIQPASYLRLAQTSVQLRDIEQATRLVKELGERLAVGEWRDVGGFWEQRVDTFLADVISDSSWPAPELVRYRNLRHDFRKWYAQQVPQPVQGEFRYFSTDSPQQLVGYTHVQELQGQDYVVGWLVDQERLEALLGESSSRPDQLAMVPLSGTALFLGTSDIDSHSWSVVLDSPAGWGLVYQPSQTSSWVTDPRVIPIFGALFILLIGLALFWREMEHTRMQQEFVSSVSHELRKPLNALRYFLGMIEPEQQGESESRSNWEWARSTLLQLQNMIENVLCLARIQQGKFPLDFNVGYVDGVVESAVCDFQFRMEEEGFKVRLEIEAKLPEIRFDATMLYQALTNLLDNALEYSRIHKHIQEKRIDVSVYSESEGAAITVRDYGIGILPRNQNRIFQRFYREKRDLKMPAGTGLGLAIVDVVVKSHGGHIDVESCPMQGSTFTLWLPEYKDSI